ncbi:MAG: hypothetical protein IPN80_05275 [Flavobacterium sp.]|nr:hypothetical protein [Flavobacterium sp.]
MKKTILSFLVIFSFSCYAQTEVDTINPIKLDEILVSPLRHVQTKRKIAQQVESISKKEIEFLNNPNAADLLANTGKLTIQNHSKEVEVQ